MRARGKSAKPTCSDLRTWLRLNLGREALGMLTGTDARALDAAAHILEAWHYSGNDELLDAFRIVVLTMQPKTQQFAYHAVAYMGDWETRARAWVIAELPAPSPVWKCAGDHS